MDEQAFADRVMAALERKQKPREYADFYGWREAWFEAWIDDKRAQRAELVSATDSVRETLDGYRRRIEAGRDFAGVMESLQWHIHEDAPQVAFGAALVAYLDAQGTPQERAAAAALTDVLDTSTHARRWLYTPFSVPFEADPDEPYAAVMKANQWVQHDSRHMGAVYARMRRIAEKGSATPLDREEAEWLALVELRYHYRCEVDSMGGWHRRDYSALHRRLHALKWIALIDVAERHRDALLIGDSAGVEAAERARDVVDTMFGGNVDAHGQVIWQKDLTDEQRAAWQRWKAETNTFTVATGDVAE